MSHPMRMIVASFLTMALYSEPHAWRTIVGSGRADVVAFDVNGDVVSGGPLADGSHESAFGVCKLRGSDGAMLWRHDVADAVAPSDGVRWRLVTTPAGDVAAAGAVTAGASTTAMAVVALAAADGAERWRVTLQGSMPLRDTALDLHLAPPDDVVVTGTTFSSSAGDVTTVRLALADGRERWRTVLAEETPGAAAAYAVAIDSLGNVILGGAEPGTFTDMTIAKLAGSDGRVVWHRRLDLGSFGGDIAYAVAADLHDDIVGAGQTETSLAAVKLDGSTGTERWRRVIGGPSYFRSLFGALVVGPDGDAFLSGSAVEFKRDGRTKRQSVAVVRLGADDGAVRWRTLLPGGPANFDQGRAIALDAAGHVVVTGGTSTKRLSEVLTLANVQASTGRQRWIRRFSARGASEQGHALAVAPNGDLVVGGTLDGFAVLRCDARGRGCGPYGLRR